MTIHFVRRAALFMMGWLVMFGLLLACQPGCLTGAQVAQAIDVSINCGTPALRGFAAIVPDVKAAFRRPDWQSAALALIGTAIAGFVVTRDAISCAAARILASPQPFAALAQGEEDDHVRAKKWLASERAKPENY